MEFNLELYLNANNAHKATCRRSTSGGVVMCAGASFLPRTQTCVTLSYLEMECGKRGV